MFEKYLLFLSKRFEKEGLPIVSDLFIQKYLNVIAYKSESNPKLKIELCEPTYDSIAINSCTISIPSCNNRVIMDININERKEDYYNIMVSFKFGYKEDNNIITRKKSVNNVIFYSPNNLSLLYNYIYAYFGIHMDYKINITVDNFEDLFDELYLLIKLYLRDQSTLYRLSKSIVNIYDYYTYDARYMNEYRLRSLFNVNPSSSSVSKKLNEKIKLLN